MAKRKRREPRAGEQSPAGVDTPPPRRRSGLRSEARFLITFALVLAGSFALLAWRPVNDGLVEPFTGLVARASGVALRGLGQEVVRSGTVLRTARFGVNIRNGCNGVEAMVILLAAIVAFPAHWRARLLGLAIGGLAIQAVNLLRVVALFLTGAYLPRFFDAAHTVVWQSLVILSAVLIWILWARRVAPRPAVAA
ncbi:MAG TPA: exosortase H [Thermoanaerobaculia bacterium]|jgi:exosortase H (IPTLxxWG-CTERM-specific)|nr:exosortase H [Thermoanaerobaculia bacterium]